MISDQEIVHKKLAPPLYKVKHISGITTLANGEACLILSVSDIISTIGSKKIGTKIISKNGILKTKDNFKYKILIVDDSHTTRILQKNILSTLLCSHFSIKYILYIRTFSKYIEKLFIKLYNIFTKLKFLE